MTPNSDHHHPLEDASPTAINDHGCLSLDHEHDGVVSRGMATATEDMMHEFLQGVTFDHSDHPILESENALMHQQRQEQLHDASHCSAAALTDWTRHYTPDDNSIAATETGTVTESRSSSVLAEHASATASAGMNCRSTAPGAASAASETETSKPTETDPTCTRTIRKRAREQQRRKDVNTKFDELVAVLKRIEEKHREHQKEKTTAVTTDAAKSLFPPPSTPCAISIPNNRVDLIARTIQVLEALSNERQSLLNRTEELDRELKRAKKAGEETAAKLKEAMTQPVSAGRNQMLMMVPMLVNNNSTTNNSANGHNNENHTMMQHTSNSGETGNSNNGGGMATGGNATAVPMQPFMQHGMAMPMPGMMQFPAHSDGSAMTMMTPWGPMMMPTTFGTATQPTASNSGIAGFQGHTTNAMPNMPLGGLMPMTTMMSPSATHVPVSTQNPSNDNATGGNLDANASTGKPAATATAAGSNVSDNYAHCA